MIESFAVSGDSGARPVAHFLRRRIGLPLAARLDRAVVEARRLGAWRSFEQHAVVEQGARIFSTAVCVNFGNPASIQIGERFVCRGTIRREAFGEGSIVIGDDVYIGDYSLISCANHVDIGDDVLIAFDVRIFDNDTHPLDARARVEHVRRLIAEGHHADAPVSSAPIAIGDRAWIGMGAMILKGVTIGDDAIVAAGSVVTNDVPPKTIVAGNPARVVREVV